MKLNKLITSVVSLSLAITAFAQVGEIPAGLASRLNGKRKYVEIMKEVDQYYKVNNFYADAKLYREYKRWNRWAWWAARHINAQGEVKLETSKYFEEAKRMTENNNANRTASNAGAWTSVGPVSTSWGIQVGSRGIGRIDRLAIHPTNASLLLAGSPSGGLWRTANGGNSWVSISASIPNCGIAGIVFSNNDPSGNTIYILTGQKVAGNFLGDYGLNRNALGVLITTNGGGAWSKLGNSEMVLRNKVPQKLLQLRNFPNVLLAATTSGLYKTTDFGATWTLATNSSGTQVFDIEQHPTDDAIVYYASDNFVGKSTDYGQSFNVFGSYAPATSSATSSHIAVTPANPNEVYFLQCGNDINTNTIYKSTNSGGTYTRINTQNLIVSAPWYNHAFAVNPVNNNRMVAAGLSLSSSVTNGAGFSGETVGNTGSPIPPNYLHSDIHDVAYTPNGVLLYAACDGGVSLSTDNGVTWADRSVGLQCTQYYHAEGFEGVENLYIGGTQDNGTHYTTNGSNMVYSGSGDGFISDFVNSNNNLYFQVENTSITRFNRSTNTRINATPASGNGLTFYPDLICHPTNGNIVYAGYRDTIWRSLNQGGTWAPVRMGGTNDGVVPSPSGLSRNYNGGFAVSPQQPDRIYAANGNAIIRSDNQGANWVTISGTNGWPAAIGTITDMATSRANANELWVTTTGNSGASRVLYSGNAGASWVDFTGSLPNVPVYSIFCTSQGDVYCGTELGVYFMDFAMNDWLPFYNGLPMIPVTDLFVSEANNSITAATWGRGLWRSDLYNDCSAFLTLSSSVQGRYFYQTGGILQSTQTMSGTVGNELRYRSPSKISLKNGFTAKAGSYLHGVIGPCGQGVFNRTDTTAAKTKAEELGLPGR